MGGVRDVVFHNPVEKISLIQLGCPLGIPCDSLQIAHGQLDFLSAASLRANSQSVHYFRNGGHFRVLLKHGNQRSISGHSHLKRIRHPSRDVHQSLRPRPRGMVRRFLRPLG